MYRLGHAYLSDVHSPISSLRSLSSLSSLSGFSDRGGGEESSHHTTGPEGPMGGSIQKTMTSSGWILSYSQRDDPTGSPGCGARQPASPQLLALAGWLQDTFRKSTLNQGYGMERAILRPQLSPLSPCQQQGTHSDQPCYRQRRRRRNGSPWLDRNSCSLYPPGRLP